MNKHDAPPTENTFMCGDCLERMKELPDNSVDMVLADPPFGTTSCKWDSVISPAPMWEHLIRVTKRDAAIVLVAQTPFDKVLGCSNLEMLKYEWIWEKTSATGFLNAKKAPLKAHENCLVFYRNLPTYNPQKTQGHVRKTSSKQSVSSECYGTANKRVQYDSTERYPRSVQVFASDKQTNSLHPTQKPLALMEYLVRTYSNAGDRVLDFCMGSGTTGEACVRLGRHFTGMEKDMDYFIVAMERVATARRISR